MLQLGSQDRKGWSNSSQGANLRVSLFCILLKLFYALELSNCISTAQCLNAPIG